MNSPDKCEYCNNEPEFLCLVEDDLPPRTKTLWLCSEHMNKETIIESWTKKEWLNME